MLLQTLPQQHRVHKRLHQSVCRVVRLSCHPLVCIPPLDMLCFAPAEKQVQRDCLL